MERDGSLMENTLKTKKNSETQTSPKEERRSTSSRGMSSHLVYAQVKKNFTPFKNS